ncbi:MAG: BAX inhibitor (BI)-1/YccA family protein, partial [Bacilli bacterium]|nr:BAX inhibitor (BI)-1/YccA family protein [Bacilli bacterium]
DVNKIKAYLMDGDAPNKMAIYGALELYLDFINIFLYLLRLFGKSND